MEFAILNHKTNSNGFTLIELLIVITIIAILSAMGIVNYRLAIQRAELANCISNLHVIGLALNAYAVDYSVYPYADGHRNNNQITVFGQGPAGNGYWSAVPMQLYYLNYLTDKNILWCPTLSKRHPGRKNYLRYAMNGTALDLGGPVIKPGASGHYWLAACLYINSQWNSNNALPWPHGEHNNMENILIHTGQINTLIPPWTNHYDSIVRDNKQTVIIP